MVVTEQYPRGLGHTVPELADHLLPSHLVLEKVTFSMMCGAPEDEESASKLEQYLQENEVNKVLLCKGPTCTLPARPRAPRPHSSCRRLALRKSAAADTLAVLFCAPGGVETHVCVLQTTLDLLALGVDTTIIVDGVSSQRPSDRAVALRRMERAGAVLSTAESTLFQLLVRPRLRAPSPGLTPCRGLPPALREG